MRCYGGEHINRIKIAVKLCIGILLISNLLTNGLFGNAAGDDERKTSPSPFAISREECHALLDDGRLFVWGRSDFLSTEAELVMEDVYSVSAYMFTILAIKNDCTLWKVPMYGNLYQGPIKIMDGVVLADTGTFHYIALKQDGSLWGWGGNTNGQIGNGKVDDVGIEYEPTKIMGNVRFAATSNAASFAILADDSLWYWGKDISKEYDAGEHILYPTKIMEDVKYVSGSGAGMLAISNDGTLWALGNIDGTESGLNFFTEPTPIMNNVAYAGDCLAITDSGELWIWGALLNWYSEKKTVKMLKIMGGVTYADYGHNHIFVLTKTGELSQIEYSRSRSETYAADEYSAELAVKGVMPYCPEIELEFDATGNMSDFPVPTASPILDNIPEASALVADTSLNSDKPADSYKPSTELIIGALIILLGITVAIVILCRKKSGG